MQFKLLLTKQFGLLREKNYSTGESSGRTWWKRESGQIYMSVYDIQTILKEIPKGSQMLSHYFENLSLS